MKVLKNNILVKEPEKVEKKSEGGIILQSREDDYTSTVVREVISVGEEVKGVSIGDSILYRVKAGVTFKNEGDEYRVLDVSDIIVVL